MDAVLESGRNSVSKHPNERADTDGTAECISLDDRVV